MKASIRLVCIALTLLGLANVAPAQEQARFDDRCVVRVQVNSLRELQLVKSISTDIWNCHVRLGAPLDVMVRHDQLAEFEEIGLPYSVSINNVQELIDNERADVRGTSFFDDYQTLDQVNAYMDTLAALRPDLVNVITLGQSLEGRDIKGMVITSPGGGTKPGIFYHGGQHCREWITVPVTMYIADQIIRNYDTDPYIQELVDRCEWYIVPVMNPDGYVYTHTSNRLWRKNRRNNGDGTFGVDLNRNWGYEWGGAGSSGFTDEETYRGPTPFSEPETQVMRDFIIAHPNIMAHLDNHSFSQLLLYPWAHTTDLPPDDALYNEISTNMVETIASISGRTYVNGPVGPTLYLASGGSIDWVYGDRGILSMTYEFRDTGANGFILPANQIIPNCEEIFPTALYFADVATVPVRISYPDGKPQFVTPAQGTTLRVDIEDNAETVDTTTAELMVRSVGARGGFTPIGMTSLGNGEFEATIPGELCGSTIEYYTRVQTTEGSTITDPADAPTSFYTTQANDLVTFVDDDFETDMGWVVSGDATDGQWSRGVPADGDRGDPATDGDGSGQCWLTDNVAGNSDVDGGTTILTSPLFDASEGGFINYQYWMDSGPGTISNDFLSLEVATDEFSSNWTELRSYTTPQALWRSDTIDIAGEVGSTPNLRLRFLAADLGTASLIEAAIDGFEFIGVDDCPPPPVCPGDADGDLTVDFDDLNIVLSNWATSGPEGDVDSSGTVDFDDLNEVLTNWNADCN